MGQLAGFKRFLIPGIGLSTGSRSTVFKRIEIKVQTEEEEMQVVRSQKHQTLSLV